MHQSEWNYVLTIERWGTPTIHIKCQWFMLPYKELKNKTKHENMHEEYYRTTPVLVALSSFHCLLWKHESFFIFRRLFYFILPPLLLDSKWMIQGWCNSCSLRSKVQQNYAVFLQMLTCSTFCVRASAHACVHAPQTLVFNKSIIF